MKPTNEKSLEYGVAHDRQMSRPDCDLKRYCVLADISIEPDFVI